MTVVSTPETGESTGEKKRINKYKRGPRYAYEPLPPYSMPYIYYPPPSVYYPTATRDDDDLEIIMHEESNTSSADLTRRSDQSKTADLKEQLEYYFSRQNLVNDTYLVSQMDTDFYVPISIVANFRRVREWTTDLSIIVKTLRESSTVTVNELGTRVKPNISVQRKTVIMRDVPECTTQEIDDLLKELDSPPVQSIKQDIGNMWYFTFESEDDALKLLTSVRGKSFKDQAIAARMKSEPIIRVNQRSSTSGPEEQIPPVYYGNYYNYQPQMYPRRPYNNTSGNHYNQKTTQVGGRSSPRVGYRPRYVQNNKTQGLLELENDVSRMAINDDNKRALPRFNNNNKYHKNSRPSGQGQNYSRPSNRRNNQLETSNVEVVSHPESSSAPPPRRQESNDNKKKKSNNTTTTTINNNTKHDINRKRKSKSTNHIKNKDEDLKPTHFPPLPSLNETTKSASLLTEPAKTSTADIVKSGPKKKEETEAFPSLCIQNDEFKRNPFSYADMLKRKDHQQ